MTQEKELNKLKIDDTNYLTNYTPKYLNRKPYVPYDSRKVYAIIPGVIQEILVKKGQAVQKNQSIIILEAMKMKNVIVASRDGKIKTVHVQTGTMVPKGELLLEFE